MDVKFHDFDHLVHHETIEVQLAHANGGSVRGIYNHAQYLDKRREMMQWWADWLDEKVEWLSANFEYFWFARNHNN
ncbi:TPA: integrase [Escherichia coli]|nr:integrase [Escherichia coli]